MICTSTARSCSCPFPRPSSSTSRSARGLGEEVFLAPLAEEIATGQTRADRLLALHEGAWGGHVTPVYDACRL